MPFFRLIARILTFCDKKVPYFNVLRQNRVIWLFCNKTMLRHAKDVRPASLFVISLPNALSGSLWLAVRLSLALCYPSLLSPIRERLDNCTFPRFITLCKVIWLKDIIYVVSSGTAAWLRCFGSLCRALRRSSFARRGKHKQAQVGPKGPKPAWRAAT